jgi:hypothetical protein
MHGGGNSVITDGANSIYAPFGMSVDKRGQY